jgi:hypothetical protein
MHRGKTYESPADVIEELVTDRDKWKALAVKLQFECDHYAAGLHALKEALREYSGKGNVK